MKPVYGPWIEWNGRECPVPPDTRVHFRTKSNKKNPSASVSEDDLRPASSLRWTWEDKDDDIVLFRCIWDEADRLRDELDAQIAAAGKRK